MTSLKEQKVMMYVDRSSQRWIVRDLDGKYWIMPAVDHPWDHREPFDFSEKTELEPISGHYKYLLDLPF